MGLKPPANSEKSPQRLGQRLRALLGVRAGFGDPGIMELARGEARGDPRNNKFDPEIGSSPLAKKVTRGITKGVKRLDKAQDCGQEPKDVRV